LPYLTIPWRNTEAIASVLALAGCYGAAIAVERGIKNAPSPSDIESISVDVERAAAFTFGAFLSTLSRDGIGSPEKQIKSVLGLVNLGNRYRTLCTNQYKTRDGKFFHIHAR